MHIVGPGDGGERTRQILLLVQGKDEDRDTASIGYLPSVRYVRGDPAWNCGEARHTPGQRLPQSGYILLKAEGIYARSRR